MFAFPIERKLRSASSERLANHKTAGQSRAQRRMEQGREAGQRAQTASSG